MPSQTFVLGFVANDLTPYAITSNTTLSDADTMEVTGSYNQDDTFTLQRYSGRAQLTQNDWEIFDGIDGMTFPITDAEWNALTPLINNARGVTIPRIDVYTD